MWGFLVFGTFVTAVGLFALYGAVTDQMPVKENGKPFSRRVKITRAAMILAMGIVVVALSVLQIW